MPIYDYNCPDCGRKVNVFFRSIGAAEAAAEVVCPRCGGKNLRRRAARVRVMRHVAGASVGTLADDDDIDSDEPLDDFGGMGGMEQMMAGVDENDPRSIARFARQMQAQAGEDIDPEMDNALTRIERGEDPDKVLEDFGEGDMPADDGYGE